MKLRTESNTVVLVTSDTVQLKILSLTIDTVITPVEIKFFLSSFYCIVSEAKEIKSGGSFVTVSQVILGILSSTVSTVNRN